MSYQHWQPCAICRAPAQEAVCGNRLLSRWDVWQLPRERVPAVSWRCERHRRYKMRATLGVRATEDGDLLFSLVCGHKVCWVFRGQWAYTPAMIERAIATRQIRLNRRQRCYACGGQESEAPHDQR